MNAARLLDVLFFCMGLATGGAGVHLALPLCAAPAPPVVQLAPAPVVKPAEDVVPEFEMLPSRLPQLRRPAMPRLWAPDVSTAPGDLPALGLALGSSSWHEREMASTRLEDIGWRALPQLRRSVLSRDPEVRRRALVILEGYYRVFPTRREAFYQGRLPSIFQLTGHLIDEPRRITPHTEESLRRESPPGIPHPVGFAEFSVESMGWRSDWHLRPAERLATRRQGATAVLAFAYYLRAGAESYRLQRRLKSQQHWFTGDDDQPENATALLVIDLLDSGVAREWVRRLLDDMCSRDATYMGEPSLWLQNRYGVFP